jgi:DNA-binding LacI/PurR family transcriptional regulator
MTDISIEHEIRKMIYDRDLEIGNRLPSERWLSAEFGVSRLTIQTALRKLELQGLVRREPNRRPIVSVDKSTLGRMNGPLADQIAIWMLPDSQDIGGVMMIQGIQAEFGSENFRLLIGCPPSSRTEEVQEAELKFLNSLAHSPNVAGAIVWHNETPGCEEAYRRLLNGNVPLVFIDREPSEPMAADVVCTDHLRAAKSAVRHLIDLGHRRIAMVVASDRGSSVRDRIDGYRLALLGAGIEPNPSWLHSFCRDQGVDNSTRAQRTLTQVLTGNDRPTAIFAVNDGVALQLQDAARLMHLRIPEHFSLMGFDWLMRMLPSGGDITTVSQPFDLIGRVAAQRLLSRIANPSDPPRHVMFNAPLVIKHSTGAPCDSPLPLSQIQS